MVRSSSVILTSASAPTSSVVTRTFPSDTRLRLMRVLAHCAATEISGCVTVNSVEVSKRFPYASSTVMRIEC